MPGDVRLMVFPGSMEYVPSAEVKVQGEEDKFFRPRSPGWVGWGSTMAAILFSPSSQVIDLIGNLQEELGELVGGLLALRIWEGIEVRKLRSDVAQLVGHVQQGEGGHEAGV